MIVNRFSGVIERYIGEIHGQDTWEVVYDPKQHGIAQLEFAINEIKRSERLKFAQKLNALANEFK